MSNSKVDTRERHHLSRLRDLHFKAQGGLCYFCQREMTPAGGPAPQPGTTATIEHLKSRSIGGGSNYLNTAASCLDCNLRRSKQQAVAQRTVPRIQLRQRREKTYIYTIPSDPFTYCLFNSSQGRDAAMMAIRSLERCPVTLKYVSGSNGESD